MLAFDMPSSSSTPVPFATVIGCQLFHIWSKAFWHMKACVHFFQTNQLLVYKTYLLINSGRFYHDVLETGTCIR